MVDATQIASSQCPLHCSLLHVGVQIVYSHTLELDTGWLAYICYACQHFELAIPRCYIAVTECKKCDVHNTVAPNQKCVALAGCYTQGH